MISQVMEVRLGFCAGPDGTVPVHLILRWTMGVGTDGVFQSPTQDWQSLGRGGIGGPPLSGADLREEVA